MISGKTESDKSKSDLVSGIWLDSDSETWNLKVSVYNRQYTVKKYYKLKNQYFIIQVGCNPIVLQTVFAKWGCNRAGLFWQQHTDFDYTFKFYYI